jgi:hypothetical protein
MKGALIGKVGSVFASPRQPQPAIQRRTLLRTRREFGRNVRFSNRPFGVKHFQAIHHCRIYVARGLALLFGIGTRALPSWDPRTRWNNLMSGLADRTDRSKRTCELTSSVVPRGTLLHYEVDLGSPPIGFDPKVFILPLRLVRGSSGIQRRQSRCGA